MLCNNCGKEITDGAKFCNNCGAPVPEPAPRHARPDPEEEVYSYSDKNLHDELDRTPPEEPTRVFDPIRDAAEETRVYDLKQHEDDRFQQDQPYDPNKDINDSYENYSDGEDDQTFMDRMDNRFRRYDDEDEDRPPKKNKTWLWITLGVLAAVLIIVFAILAFSGSIFKGDNKPTSLPTAAATVKPTEKPTEKATEKPQPTKAPETKAPETQAPATQAPATEAPPITEAPKPTDPPVTPTDAPTQPSTEGTTTVE